MREGRNSDFGNQPTRPDATTTRKPNLCRDCKVAPKKRCPFPLILKWLLFSTVVILFVVSPMGDPSLDCKKHKKTQCCNVTALSHSYYAMGKVLYVTASAFDLLLTTFIDSLYKAKLLAYDVLARIDKSDLCHNACEKTNNVHLCGNTKMRFKDKYTKMSSRKDEYKRN